MEVFLHSPRPCGGVDHFQLMTGRNSGLLKNDRIRHRKEKEDRTTYMIWCLFNAILNSMRQVLKTIESKKYIQSSNPFCKSTCILLNW